MKNLTLTQRLILRLVLYITIVLSIPACSTIKQTSSTKQVHTVYKDSNKTYIRRDTIIFPKSTNLDFSFPTDSSFTSVDLTDSTGQTTVTFTKGKDGRIHGKTKTKPNPIIVDKVYEASTAKTNTIDSTRIENTKTQVKTKNSSFASFTMWFFGLTTIGVLAFLALKRFKIL